MKTKKQQYLDNVYSKLPERIEHIVNELHHFRDVTINDGYITEYQDKQLQHIELLLKIL